MVVLLDLDDQDPDIHDPHALHDGAFARHHDYYHSIARGDSWKSFAPVESRAQEPSPDDEINKGSFSSALSCYPVVSELAHHIDQNTLHSLSMTCRQFRANLLPFRRQLVMQTIRCVHDADLPLISSLKHNFHNPYFPGDATWDVFGTDGVEVGRLTSGKVGRCARDMVLDCRRCGRCVCRNCTSKPPPNPALKERFRRLCRTCRSVPLSYHLNIVSTRRPSPGNSPFASPSTSPILSRSYISYSSQETPAFTAPAFIREPCKCTEMVWLCTSCGNGLRNNDTTYNRVWTWRTRYSTYLGGLGTGIGEGAEGVKCGRGDLCLAGRDVEVEMDCCEAQEMTGHNHSHSPPSSSPPRNWADSPGPPSAGSHEDKPGYLQQEIEGLGGTMKKKVKVVVRVGATVEEWEDERERGAFLERERRGDIRAWCGWCDRVIPKKGESAGA